MNSHRRSAYVLMGLATALYLPSCAIYSGPVGEISNIVVGETGGGSNEENCRDFRISVAEVKSFFRRAVLITPRQEHDFYMSGACNVRGTFSTRYGAWQWQMHSLGTARLTSVGSDETFLLADPQQESSLADEQ